MSARSSHVPPVRFAQSGNARLAYQFFGEGKEIIVAIPPMAQHIEMAWERPEIRRMLERFAGFSRYLHFDKRGTGASDRTSHVPGIDERVSDLEAVMDHAGIEKAHLYGCSEGGPMAILFAATYPERVQSLSLAGACASHLPKDITEAELEARREIHEAFLVRWGTPESPVADGFAPSLAADPEFRTWHQKYERSAASTDSLRDLLDLTLEMDVRALLPTLDVPTFVTHRRGDRVVPIEFGRELAESIPGAVIFEQEGEDHFGYAGDVDGWMNELERFITGEVNSAPVRDRPSDVKIVTLGRFAVICGEAEVPIADWGSRLARQICKRLVALRGWPVTRDELFDMCWPEEHDVAKLGARLSVQLSIVRRVLGGGVIADRSTVRLDLSKVRTDLEAFYEAKDDETIVAMYQGEFLPSDRYEDWTGGSRDEARARFKGAARRLARKFAEGGDYEEASRVARRLIAADPFDDDSHRLCIVSLLAMGERGQAIKAHQRWEALMSDLGFAVDSLEELAS